MCISWSFFQFNSDACSSVLLTHQLCPLLPGAAEVAANSSKAQLQARVSPQPREHPTALADCCSVPSPCCLLGFLFQGWGLFSSYQSPGQILPHMPQHSTARTQLRPLLMLRMAFSGKYTIHGIRMCFKGHPFHKTYLSCRFSLYRTLSCLWALGGVLEPFTLWHPLKTCTNIQQKEGISHIL